MVMSMTMDLSVLTFNTSVKGTRTSRDRPSNGYDEDALKAWSKTALRVDLLQWLVLAVANPLYIAFSENQLGLGMVLMDSPHDRIVQVSYCLSDSAHRMRTKISLFVLILESPFFEPAVWRN
jgi:hypothetical protein